MAKYTYKEIKNIIEATPENLRGLQINSLEKSYYVGYFTKSTANWSYQVYIVESCGRLLPVVVVFGSIR